MACLREDGDYVRREGEKKISQRRAIMMRSGNTPPVPIRRPGSMYARKHTEGRHYISTSSRVDPFYQDHCTEALRLAFKLCTTQIITPVLIQADNSRNAGRVAEFSVHKREPPFLHGLKFLGINMVSHCRRLNRAVSGQHQQNIPISMQQTTFQCRS